MTIKLESIFEKPVDRRIEGVIKADDEAGLLHELEEYVITDEVAKHLEAFLEAYRTARNDNGVWISGFFGSGKSHLLKMLALLLENREVGGKTALEIFQEKLKDNEFLRAELGSAAAIPSKSILFNIDQKADVISKTQIDALLAVFQKVFDESCGYYGKQGHVAQFERHLDENGHLEAFKSAFASAAGKSWEEGREQHILESRSIAKAYADATGGRVEEAADVLKRYRENYKVSIEDFAEQINKFVERQGGDFRLNFFVDEVGQYVAENTKLMTNLQTVAESLSTKCRGKAWIIVTAQQQMDEIVGDMSKNQALDYSKIMARFATRMPLTSANVSEVIQKRLLKKTDDAIEPVGKLYDQFQNDMRTLFSFGDGSVQLKGFRDREHFIASYPFLPYQYDLFQLAIRELSNHNAFEGRHASVGERSMLGVFQQVAKEIKDLELGAIAPFDLMYEGIRSALKASVQSSIQLAEKHLSDELATRVLKATFLVKYVKQFKPTLENICVLVRTRFDGDAAKLCKEVEAALSLLEQQTYIRRNGTLYEFLTDEEKDVEDEIKNIEIDSSEIENSLENFFFGIGIRTAKFSHEATGGDYRFARKIDDQLMGRDAELAINIITPYNPNSDATERFRMETLTSNDLCVVLPSDPRFIQDLAQFKKTEKYVRQASSQQHQPVLQRIIGDKREQIGQRERALEVQAKKLLSDARIFVRGQELEVSIEEPQARMSRAFNTLIDKVYTNLNQLKGVTYTDGHISEALSKSDDGLFGADGTGIPEAEKNVVNHIRMTKEQALRSTVKSVIEQFEKAPYGWPRVAIQAQLASLFARGRIEAKKDSLSLNAVDFGKALRNTQEFGNIVLEPQVEFTQGQIAAVRKFYKEFFDEIPKASEARALAEETIADLKKEAANLRTLAHGSAHYPFAGKLEPIATQISQVAELGVNGLYTKLAPLQDELLDAKEDVVDPIKRFINGDRGRIYDEAYDFIQKQGDNLAYLPGVSDEAVQKTLSDPDCYRGDSIQRLRSEIEELKAKVEEGLSTARKNARAELTELKSFLVGMPGYAKVSQIVEARFEQAAANLDELGSIPLLKRALDQFKGAQYATLLSEVERDPNDGSKYAPGESGEGGKPRATSLIPIATLKLSDQAPVLSSEEDVDKYLERLRARLLEELHSGNRISL